MKEEEEEEEEDRSTKSNPSKDLLTTYMCARNLKPTKEHFRKTY